MIPAGNIRILLRELDKQGWRVVKTQNTHYRAMAPEGGVIVLFSDSREPRSWLNTLSRLRKAGFRA